MTEASSKLLENGLLGALFVLSLAGVVWLSKSLRAVLDQRVADSRDFGDRLREMNASSQQVLMEMKTTVDALSRALDEYKHTTTRELDSLSDAVRDMKDEHLRTLARASIVPPT
jgi:hypothetical protein